MEHNVSRREVRRHRQRCAAIMQTRKARLQKQGCGVMPNVGRRQKAKLDEERDICRVVRVIKPANGVPSPAAASFFFFFFFFFCVLPHERG